MSHYKTLVRLGVGCISETALPLIDALTDDRFSTLRKHVEKIVAKTAKHETLNLTHWMDDLIYFEVKSVRFPSYPTNIRMLVSFNLTTGEVYRGRHRHYVCRRGWGAFFNQLAGFKPILD